MTDSTEHKVALITGTSSGFGLLTSVALAKRGYQVISTLRDLGKQQRLLDEAKAAGIRDNIEVMQLDVTDTSRVAEVVKECLLRHKHIDILVNNAGFAVGGFVEEVPLSEWKRQFETNVFGVISMTQAVLPIMRQAKQGLIINISSVSGRLAFPGLGPYSASKFALEGFSEALRMEMAPYGVRVVLIEPASYKTNVWERGLSQAALHSDTAYPREAEMMLKTVTQLAESGGNPEEVVQLIERIVQLPNPRLRYPIGRGVRTMLWAKTVLPWRLIERTVGKRLQ